MAQEYRHKIDQIKPFSKDLSISMVVLGTKSTGQVFGAPVEIDRNGENRNGKFKCIQKRNASNHQIKNDRFDCSGCSLSFKDSSSYLSIQRAVVRSSIFQKSKNKYEN